MKNISPKLRRIAKLASEAPELAFNTLGHLLSVELLTEAYRRTRESGAVGVDATWQVLMKMGGCWVLEVDIKSLFDELDHDHLRGFVRKRVCVYRTAKP